MFERASLDDLHDGLSVDAVMSANPERNLSVRCPSSNIDDGIDGQLRSTVAPLTRHVGEVVGNGANEQMVRIAARAIVASVAHLQARVYLAVCQFVRDAVCAELMAVTLERAVTGAASAPAPRPAFANGSARNL